MTEFSMLWETQTGTGDGSSTYTQGQANFFFKDYTLSEPATQGVLSGVDNEMLATVAGANSIDVDTGKASVYGFRYLNDAIETLAVAGVGADTGGRVILRASWITNTVRLIVIQSASGVTTFPALTQTAGTTWDIPVANFIVDSGGSIYPTTAKLAPGIADARSFALTPLAGMVRLREYIGDGSSATATFNYIQQDLTNLLIVGHARSTAASGSISTGSLQFNLDTGTNYTYHQWSSSGAAVNPSVTFLGAQTSIPVSAISNTVTGVANQFDPFRIQIPNYSFASGNAGLLADYGGRGSSSANTVFSHLSGWWSNTSAVTRIDISLNTGNWATDSKIVLYGMR